MQLSGGEGSDHEKDQDETSLMSTIIKYTMMKKDFAADTSVVLMLSKKY